MDNLSYRNNRPSPRNNSEAEQQPVVAETPRTRPAASTAKHPQPSKKRPWKYIIGLLLLALIVAGAWYFVSRSSNVSSAIDGSKYQAVFFTNGQVYFGKLSPINDEYMRLTNVYYLQAKSDTKQATPQSASKQDSSDVELIKLGGEIHGPEDAMIVSKDQMLFFENLKPKGNVSETITSFQNQNKSN